ncbi:hypothetical protein ACZ87_02903 [Candidatus Erwinia dacicola]|uniref:Uncharacterized protein n=1 Tax=Candidatus Erwinia dacicola TaxID=252393 RepID=A0A328TLI9_9GAMM|nr:hypothetical protein ACZ87_02903 [Candidatus Erwinia dacicola]
MISETLKNNKEKRSLTAVQLVFEVQRRLFHSLLSLNISLKIVDGDVVHRILRA